MYLKGYSIQVLNFKLLQVPIEFRNASFLVEDTNGLSKTRSGRFHINDKGNIATQDGHEVVIVEKTDKLVNLSAEFENIRINNNGEIFVSGARYGRFALEMADNKPVTIHQGMVEGSNVNLVQEMASLGMAYRALEAAEKSISLIASVDRDLIDKYGKNV